MKGELFESFDNISAYCFNLFKSKNGDYGPTWLLFRYPSLCDEIWRKAKRIRTLEEHDDNALIPEGRDVEYIGIINYCIMFLIRLQSIDGIPPVESIVDDLSDFENVDSEKLYKAYENIVNEVRELLVKKNTDYGDAWRSMSITSMTDQVIIRVYRIRKILSNGGKCAVSEGVASQLNDIINYCIFALIKMEADVING